MENNDVEELANSAGTLIEKILKLVLRKKDVKPKEKNEESN